MTAGGFVLGTRRRLAGLWQQPLQRTGSLLVANSVLNAATGVGYWLLAARLIPPAVVGINSAAISAMMLLAGVAQLNLMSTILRFVPTAGAAAGRLIRGAYLAGAALSGLAAIGFLAGLHWWAPNLSGLLRPGLPAIGFVVATMCWSVFVMQDNALVAVRRAVAVPVENLTFAILKIGLVVVFALAVPAAGIWLSWTAAMLIAVAGTTAYLFWRAVPSFAARAPAAGRPVSLRELGRFAGPDYIGALAYLAGTSLVPLLVLGFTGPRQSAPFALAWQICVALYAVPIAFGQSLVAYGAAEQERLAEYHRQALRQTLQLLVPVVALVIAFAPLGLGFFGSWYASHGTATLRLLALSAIPNAVVALEVSRARVARRMIIVVTLLTGLSAVVLGLTVLLVPSLGIVGGGVAWLAGQCLMAGVVLGRREIAALRARVVRSRSAGVPAATVHAALAGGPWACERTLAGVSDTAVVMVRTPQREPRVLKVAASGAGVSSLHREETTLRRLQADARLGDWRALLPVPLASGQLGGGAYLLTTRLPGVDGRQLDRNTADWLTPAAISAIAPLHRLDRAVRMADDGLLHRLVDEPAGYLRRAVRHGAAVDRLAAALHTQLAGHPLVLGWTHGDFYPGNVLVSPGRQVTGIVDWSQVREQDPVVLDIAFWLLTVPPPGHQAQRGTLVAARLGHDRCWTPAESALLAPWLDGDPSLEPGILLLAWLRHVADTLAKSGRYAASPLWPRQNIAPVLRWVAGPRGAGLAVTA